MVTTAGSRGRRYPPLAGGVIAALMALLVLPSALNVPQSNPTQTLEFAPVPPEDDAPPPQDSGNVESLSLGSSSTAPAGDVSGDGPGLPPPPLSGLAERPVTKRCVGNPPRQTEDPMAPPCVAHFEGDNGGAVYEGIDDDEVRILFYMDGSGSNAASGGVETRGRDEYHDLGNPPQGEEHVWLRMLRVWQAYFNDRYQTYGRTVRFHVYFTTGEGGATAETRLADAAANFNKVRPFAVINDAFHTQDPYTQEMARRGVLVFGGALMQPEEFLRSRPGQIWGFLPSIERWADLYATHVCSRVVPYPVEFGDPARIGAPRRYGLVRPDDPQHPELTALTSQILHRLDACGVTFEAEARIPVAGFVQQPDATGYSLQGMAAFVDAEVTTVLWTGGLETNFSKAAAQLNYRPEWIVAGDSFLESSDNASFNEPTVWEHAWVVSPVPYEPPDDENPCMRAFTDTAPEQRLDGELWACNWYTTIRQLFTGIQVAGPNLTPSSVDLGFHAIPPKQSNGPLEVACFYEPGDYTCVKDGSALWWDPAANGSGCYRVPLRAKRHLAGEWPEHPVAADRDPDDPCSYYSKFAPVFG